MAELRTEWVCTACAMRVYNACHDPIPAPNGWDLTEGRCLACADDENPEEYAVRMLLAGRANSRIYAKGVSNKWLDAKRRELVESGDLDPATVQQRPKPDPNGVAVKDRDKVPAIEEALRADPAQSNRALKVRLGVASQTTIAKVRKALGLQSAQAVEKEQRMEKIRQAFEDNPDLGDEGVARLLGLSTPTVGAARRKLGVPKLKPGPKAQSGSGPTRATVGSI